MLDAEGWVAICSIIFVCITYKPIKNAIMSFLDDKISAIQSTSIEAQNLKMNAEKELQVLKTELNEVEKKHITMLENAKNRFAQNIKTQCEEFDKTIDYRKHSALQSLSQAKMEAHRAIERDFLEMVLNSTSSYLSSNSSTDTDMTILEHTMGKNHNRSAKN
jgi:F0F1-type ATP synthase membrane subunit b/b'